MASFVVPLSCGIPWLAGGLFSSEAACQRTFPLSFVLDAASQKVVPQAEIIPAQVVMQAPCVSAPRVATLAADRKLGDLEAGHEADADGASKEAAAVEVQLTVAREKAMADVRAMLCSLREEVAEQEATDRAAAAGRADSDGDENGEADSLAETEWEVVPEASVEAFPMHASC